jgi:hypothetical protein
VRRSLLRGLRGINEATSRGSGRSAHVAEYAADAIVTSGSDSWDPSLSDSAGLDQDAHAFAEFIVAYLSKYGRWNSPKYLFGESYGTPRSAVLADLLEQDYKLD